MNYLEKAKQEPMREGDRRPEVIEALGVLNDGMGRLEEVVRALMAKLLPVMKQQPDSKVSPPPPPPHFSAPLALELDGMAHHAARLEGELIEALRRIEL